MYDGPDRVLYGGRVLTLDPRQPRVQALALWQGRVLAAGADDEVLALAGPGTRQVDLQGRFVCPAFTDCHVHLVWWALVASGHTANLEGAGSLEETLRRVGEAASRTSGGWLRGQGWDKNHWVEGRFPTAAELDAVTGERPAVMSSHDGHSVWANSVALRAAGLAGGMDDPPGGRALRDAQGKLTGVLQEAAAERVWAVVPEVSEAEVDAALRVALPMASRLGIAGVHDCETGEGRGAARRLRERGELTVRVTRYVPAGQLEELVELGMGAGFGDAWVRLGGVKAFLDGALGGQTAAMLDPYDGTQNRGVLTMEEGELEELIGRASGAGVAVALHAIGDRAVRLALDVFERVRGRHEGPWPRHRIEHAQHVNAADQRRLGALGLIASVQPAHLLADMATCERHLRARTAEAFPLRGLLEGGARLCLGSDAPVETMDPLVGMRAAVKRQGRDGGPAGGWHPEQRLRVEEALAGYTTQAARASGEEGLRGSLTAGRLADLVVLSHDLLDDPEGLEAARVLATMVGGEATHDPEGLLG